MKAAYALHEIVLGKDDRKSPGSVLLDLDEDTYAELEALGAIREATDDETAIAGGSVKAKSKDKAEKADKKAAKAAAKAAAPEGGEPQKEPEGGAEQKDNDPDVKVAEGNDDLLGGN